MPVSLVLRELGIGFAGPAAGAMMLVVGQEAGQIGQAQRRSRGACAPAVAGGAHDRTGIQEGETQVVDFVLIHRFEAPGGVGVLGDLIGQESMARRERRWRAMKPRITSPKIARELGSGTAAGVSRNSSVRPDESVP